MLITNKKCENETNKKIGNSVDVIDTQAVWRQSILKIKLARKVSLGGGAPLVGPEEA